jgi:predicted DNA-binding transcriptional regulator AlpA
MMKIDRYDDPLQSSTLSLNAGVAHAKLIDFKSLGPTKGINYSRDHLRRKWKSGEFPKPIVLSKTKSSNNRRICWIESEIDDWIAARAAERTVQNLPVT